MLELDIGMGLGVGMGQCFGFGVEVLVWVWRGKGEVYNDREERGGVGVAGELLPGQGAAVHSALPIRIPYVNPCIHSYGVAYWLLMIDLC